MTRSHFTTPNGLPDDDNYSTARDMAILGRALLVDFSEYAAYFKLPAIEIGGRVLKNYNKLLQRYPGATGMKTGFICASGFNLVASAKRGDREVIAVVFGQYGGKARTEQAAELLDEGFASSPPADGKIERLADAGSGAEYDAPFDMRPLVCGPRRVRAAAAAAAAADSSDEGDDSGPDASHLTADPIDLGPPVKVSAFVPAVYGEQAFVAPLPRPRPGSNTGPAASAILNAYAPGDGTATSAPADAIGAAAGSPQPLDEVSPPQ